MIERKERLPAYLYEKYREALSKGLRDAAGSIIELMAMSCPLREEHVCLVDRFCPDCRFYNHDGTRSPGDTIIRS